MELDSARELKRRCLKDLVEPDRDFRSFALAATRMARIKEPVPALALGIARKSGNQYQLAVRCQREELMDSSLVARIRRRARNECDIRFIGRLRKWLAPRWNQKRVRPLQIGLSCGHHNVTAGTLGCFVRPRGNPGTLMILSNNHVLADEDRAAVGDAVLQPGRFDGGKDPRDLVARFAKAVQLTNLNVNSVDAAVAEVVTKAGVKLKTIKGLRKLAGLGPEFIDVGTEVAKLGRSTGMRRGRVTAVELDDVVVLYDRGHLRFNHQIEIEGIGDKSFSQGGDSGSLIVEAETRLAVGLLFAGGDIGGSNGKGLTYANPIHAVLDALDIDLA